MIASKQNGVATFLSNEDKTKRSSALTALRPETPGRLGMRGGNLECGQHGPAA